MDVDKQVSKTKGERLKKFNATNKIYNILLEYNKYSIYLYIDKTYNKFYSFTIIGVPISSNT